jgi:hypothetical protein
VGFVVDKVALGQVFSEHFGFSCQSSFHQYNNNNSRSCNVSSVEYCNIDSCIKSLEYYYYIIVIIISIWGAWFIGSDLNCMIGFIGTLYTAIGSTINYSAIAISKLLEFTGTHISLH